jgi:hypothetical protein
MLFTSRSSLRFSASICASLFCSWVAVGPAAPGANVPFDLSAPPDAPAVPAEFVPGAGELVALPTPVVDSELVVDPGPGEFAVPKALIPGEVGAFAELPAPLGSFPELFSPPTFAGPLGTPPSVLAEPRWRKILTPR